MKKFPSKTPKSRKTREEKVRELINFAEELVGRECIVKEDSILALKTNDKRNKMSENAGKHISMASSATDVNIFYNYKEDF